MMHDASNPFAPIFYKNMYPEPSSHNLVKKTNSKSHYFNKCSHKEHFEQVENVCRPFFSLYSNSNQTPVKQRDFFKKLTSQELDVYKLQIFSWSLTFLSYKMSPKINELRVEVITNTFGKMQDFTYWYCLRSIPLQQQINKRLPYCL